MSEFSLKSLLEYMIKNNSSLSKRLAFSIIKYNKDEQLNKIASTVLDQSLEIDLLELESLVNPDKFEFLDSDIGLVGVKKDEDI
jgi:hypothetical protein